MTRERRLSLAAKGVDKTAKMLAKGGMTQIRKADPRLSLGDRTVEIGEPGPYPDPIRNPSKTIERANQKRQTYTCGTARASRSGGG